MNRTEIIFFGAGIGIGFYFAKLYLEDKYEAIVEEEIASIHEARRRVEEKELEDEKKEVEVVVEENNKGLRSMYDTSDRKFNYSKPPLEELAKELLPKEDVPTDTDEPEDIGELADVVKEISEGGESMQGVVPLKPHVKAEAPYVISDTDFRDYFREHDKLELMYYTEDDVLADDRDQLVDDVEYVIGMDTLDRFGEGSVDPDVVHVRNEQIGSDIEITRVHGSYSELVVGE